MARTFDQEQGREPDNPGCAQAPPEQTLLAAGLRPLDIFLDIGCGAGYFTLPAAKLVGPHGKVYALDFSAAMLSSLRAKIAATGVFNVEALETGPCDLKLPAGTGTMALLCGTLCEVDDKLTFLMEVNRVLRTGARLSIIERRRTATAHEAPVKDGPGGG